MSRELLALSADDGALLWANEAFHARFGDALPAEVTSVTVSDQGLPCTEMPIDAGWFAVQARRTADGIAWRFEDSSAQREAAEAARLRELLEVAQEFGRLGVWERDVATGRGRWDRHVFAFWGLDPAQGTPGIVEATRYIHPEDRFDPTYSASMTLPGRYAQHYRVQRPDGTVCRVHSQWEVKAGTDGRTERVVGVMMDDTEVYELARSLGDASAQLKLAVELADIAIWRHDLRSNRMHYNDRAFAVLGIPARPEGMPIEEVRAFIHPDDLTEVVASAQRALASDRPTDMQAPLPAQRRQLAPCADAARRAARRRRHAAGLPRRGTRSDRAGHAPA